MERAEIYSEIRYAIRLAERTARLYRRVQKTSIALTVIGGSAAMANVVTLVPSWTQPIGTLLFVVFGAILLAVRPAEAIVKNDADVNRYQTLLTKFPKMTDAEVIQALEEARLSDTEEIEDLRPVAFNDIVRENGADDRLMKKLTAKQRLLAAIA